MNLQNHQHVNVNEEALRNIMSRNECCRNNTNVCLNQIMTEEAFDVMVVGSCMTDLVR